MRLLRVPASRWTALLAPTLLSSLAGHVLVQRHKALTDSHQGIEGSDYHTVLARDPNTTPKYIVTGTAGCMASNRLSYFYDLSGPSVTVDTACSSSMAALHQAVRTLQHGDSSMALVCGANLIFNVESFITMTELGFLGANGRCRSFDANGDGYGRGEGICCVLLATLDYALSIEAPIRAIIKGTRLNQDGRTQGITLPSAKAQAENMCSLYQELGIDSHSIQYLEAHVCVHAVWKVSRRQILIEYRVQVLQPVIHWKFWP